MLDPGLTGRPDRPVATADNGFLAGYRVRFDEAGPDGLVRTSAFVRYAQDIAWRHSEDLGFGRAWYAERGLAWVVRSVDLRMIRPIAMGQTVRVSTAVAGHRRIWARRLTDARAASGELAARVVTDWVIVDDRGRPVRIPSEFGLAFTSPELRGEILRVAIEAPPTSATSIRFGVRPHELDPADHVNNASYLDWIEEARLTAGPSLAPGPSLAAPGRRLPSRARLEYLASAALGDEISVTSWHDGGRWFVRITRTDGVELLRGAGATGGAADDHPDIEGIPTDG
jgi:acyl-CoA thioester hydrolase